MDSGWMIGTAILIIGLVGMCVIQCFQNRKLKEKNREMEEQLRETDMSIMLSQIQPHFLYNSLSAIRELCLEDPEEAPRALEEFSSFLRGNMDSLRSKVPVPFSRELEHVKHYLHWNRFGSAMIFMLSMIFRKKTFSFRR